MTVSNPKNAIFIIKGKIKSLNQSRKIKTCEYLRNGVMYVKFSTSEWLVLECPHGIPC
jgi:hypothetical protein